MPKSSPGPSIPSTEALASYLGLSRWTVSRVINGHSGVSEKTVQRVHEAIKRLGFRPNPHALGLRGGRTGVIGVCFQELESPMLSRKTAALQNILRTNGWHSLMELTNRDATLEEEVLRHFLSMRVDAIVVIGSILRADSPMIQEIKLAGKPLLLVDPEIAKDFTSLEVDRAGALFSSVELCSQHGQSHFGLAGFDPHYAYSHDRLQGWQRAAKCFPVELAWQLFEPGVVQHDYAYGSHLAEKLRKEGHRLPDVILCVNDRVAIGLMDALKQRGVSLPEEVGVVGHDNLEISAFVRPLLTTVDQRVEILMQRAADLVVKMIGAEPSGGRINARKVSTSLVVRESHLKKTKTYKI